MAPARRFAASHWLTLALGTAHRHRPFSPSSHLIGWLQIFRAGGGDSGRTTSATNGGRDLLEIEQSYWLPTQHPEGVSSMTSGQTPPRLLEALGRWNLYNRFSLADHTTSGRVLASHWLVYNFRGGISRKCTPTSHLPPLSRANQRPRSENKPTNEEQNGILRMLRISNKSHEKRLRAQTVNTKQSPSHFHFLPAPTA